MNLVSYLTEIYGYNNPIFIKDIRIGRKSKTAIRAEFSRLTKTGELVRECQGVYSLADKTKDENSGNVVVFEDIIEKKFIYGSDMIPELKELSIIGYYSGMTFLNRLGISKQVPAIREITTNNTTSKKRYYSQMGRTAIIRKGKIEITHRNYKILQFLDSFYWMDYKDVQKNKELLINYIKQNCFTKNQLNSYINLYNFETVKKITDGGLIYAFA